MTPTTENRRHSHRTQIAIAVRKKIGEQQYLCQAADISPDGMFMASVGEETPVQGRCTVEFSLPGSSIVISAKAWVVRQMRKGHYYLTAVRFAAIAPSHRRLIGRYVSSPAFLPLGLPAFLQAS